MIYLCPLNNLNKRQIIRPITIAVFLSLTAATAQAENLIIDKDHPYSGSGTGNYSLVTSSGNDNTIIFTTYEGLLVSNRLYGIRPSSEVDVKNNTVTINATDKWFSGTAIQGTYASQASALGNHLILNGGNYAFTYSNGVVGANVSNGNSVIGNVVEVSDIDIIGAIYAADVTNPSDKVTDNKVIVHSGNFQRSDVGKAGTGIYGVYLERGTTLVANNSVDINDGHFNDEDIAAVNFSLGSPDLIENNVVTINGGTFSSEKERSNIYGVKGTLSNSPSSGNGVIINGGTFTEKTNIYAVDKVSSKTKTDNFIRINSNDRMDLTNVIFYGSSNLTANSLIINQANNLKIGGLNKFKSLDLENIVWQQSSPAVSIRGNAQFETISINPDNGFILQEGQSIRNGDRMTLVRAENSDFYSLELSNEQTDTVYTQANVARKVSGQIVKEGSDLDFVISNIELAEQVVLLGENRAVTAAFLNEGSDAALTALQTPDNLIGFTTFATAQGSASEYDANDELKINGWHFVAGMHGSTTFSDADRLRVALYFETGTGNYRTDNSFNEEHFRGDGEVSYTGGGLAMRYSQSNGFYIEGSLRAGELETEMNRAVRSAQGELLGYDSSSFYWGGHVGLGKILTNDTMKMNLYSRFYWTEVKGDSCSLGGDNFHFDDVSSRRVRVGSRVESKNLGLYLGAAYEYEFDGDAKMTVAGMQAPTESLEGSSFMGEVGWTKTLASIPLTIDTRVNGWTGERSGISGQMFFSYEF